MTDCNNNYTPIQAENFGEGKKVTSKLLRNLGENCIYLKDQTEQLWDNTDPQPRVNFTPIAMDPTKSYGVMEETVNGIPCYMFNTSTSFHGSTLFRNLNTIDETKTTAQINTGDGDATIPPVKATDITLDFTDTLNGPWGSMIANEFWYVSYSRTQPYITTSEILTNQDSTKIPAVCRAQTFKPTKTGYLRRLSLNLHANKDAQYPLIIEIYDANTYPYKKLASTTYSFDSNTGGIVAIPFQNPAYLTAGQKYSFRVRSPLTTFDKSYAIGGWSKNCENNSYSGYNGGDAWLSEDNGATWIAFGKDENVSYHDGQKKPQDFAFQLGIDTGTKSYDTANTYYVYFKPLRMDPLVQAKITITGRNESDSDNNVKTSWQFQYSVTGLDGDWVNVSASDTIDFSNNFPTTLFLRCAMSTTASGYTPHLQGVELSCTCQRPLEAYLRTEFYRPPTSNSFLSPHLWAKANAPYITMGDATVGVDLIRDMVHVENITLITVTDITPYLTTDSLVHLDDSTATNYGEYYTSAEVATLITSLQTNSVISADKVNTFLLTEDGIGLVEYLKEHSIYFNTTTSFTLGTSPAYPMIYCKLQKLDGTGYEEYGESYDYSVDYDNDLITFYDNSTGTQLTTLPAGTLTIEYNPVYIKDLTNDDFQTEETMIDDTLSTIGVTQGEGFHLDYLVETFTIGTDSDTDANKDGQFQYKTSVLPMQAIRCLKLYPDTTAEVILYEGEIYDYTVDYTTGIITFNELYNTQDLSIPAEVHYTPYLTEGGLAFAYRLKRGNNTDNNQAYLYPNSFDFRV